MSVGGPPKAVLGGPKTGTVQPAAAAAAANAGPSNTATATTTANATAAPTPARPASPPAKGKKIPIKVPVAEHAGEDGAKPEWARKPSMQMPDEEPSNWGGMEVMSKEDLHDLVFVTLVHIKSKVSGKYVLRRKWSSDRIASEHGSS
jgi:hypothetical protein